VYYDQIVIKKPEQEKDRYKTNFRMNMRLKDDLQMEFIGK